jgi:hypothetical protein
MKNCIKCNIIQSYDSFCKNKKYKDEKDAICKSCKKHYNAEWRSRFVDKVLDSSRKWARNNRDVCKESYKKWASANPDKVRRRMSLWKKSNRQICTYWENSRRAKKLNATPKWADLKKIKEMYINCPSGYHVDHIVPLNHPLVCGLHVHWNLQYLPASENLKKSNKLDVTGSTYNTIIAIL